MRRSTEIVGEIRRALDWLGADGAKHGVGAGPIVVSGWSAGGHLTAMALDHPRVAAGLAISGVYELAPIRDTYLDEKLRLTDAEIATLSPLRLPAVPKPLAIAYGTARASGPRRGQPRSPCAPHGGERAGTAAPDSPAPIISPSWKSCAGPTASSCAPRSISSARAFSMTMTQECHCPA